ncbi:hypothetical protein BGZ76_009165 [Entomortierella beljakovae]|nr:hypothetical protein BGZ76_009165 [Entomortierella beljakovae]
MADPNETESVMVSISAVSAVQDIHNHYDDSSNTKNNTLNDIHTRAYSDVESSSIAPTLSITSVASSVTSNSSSTTIDFPRDSEKPQSNNNTTTTTTTTTVPSILLPPVEIESSSIATNNKKDVINDDIEPNKENIDPLLKSSPSPKQGIVKPKSPAPTTTTASSKTAIGVKKPLTSSLGKSSATSVKKPVTSSLTKTATPSLTKPATSSLTKSATSSLTKSPLASSTAAKVRPAIPTTLRSTTSSTVARLPTTPSNSAARSTLTPSSSTTVRKSPSTPSLAGSTTTSPATGRRVASSSGVGTSSPRSSPSTTPGPTRSPSQASVSTLSSTTRKPLTSSASVSSVANRTAATSVANRATANRIAATTSTGTPKSSTTSTLATRKTPTSSTTSSPNSSLKQTASKTTVRPTAAQATALASGRKTPSSTTIKSSASTPTVTRPVTDAAKVKMLSTQLTGLQEKHDQTLKLLQEQEERMKKELEELSLIPEPQRKPIPSDSQEILKEMEDLRCQYNSAKVEHEKALDDLNAQHTLEISQIKETHTALLLAISGERDSTAESLKVLQESSEKTQHETELKINELNEQMEKSIQSHNEATLRHTEALTSLRAEIESDWLVKHESKLKELSKDHAEQIRAIEDKALVSGDSMTTEIQDLKDSFAQKIKNLEEKYEGQVLDLTTKHKSEIQELEEKMEILSKANVESAEIIKQEHKLAMDNLQAELATIQQEKLELESELERVRVESQSELEQVRAELEEARKQLEVQSAETVELKKQVEGLVDDLENASLGTKLKNTKRYKEKKVQVYGSSVSGNLKVKRAQQTINDTLEQHEIFCDFVDVSVDDEAKKYMRRKNKGDNQLPLIFSDGEYMGNFDDFEYAIETNQLAQFLGFDRGRGFVPRQKADYNQSEYSVSNAQDGGAEQGAGFPSVVVNGLANRSLPAVGPSATSMYLVSPASNRFNSTSLSPNGSPRSLKPGFVQTASQAWDGALRDDITHAKHDLGFNNTVIPDDDELDEIYALGGVTEADLQALIENA